MSVRNFLAYMSLAWLSLALPLADSFAASPRFPWHSQHSAHTPPPMGEVPVQILSGPATSPISVLPPKQAYPYGWFGSNPAPQWKRSFGVSKAYTQWSRY